MYYSLSPVLRGEGWGEGPDQQEDFNIEIPRTSYDAA
jgi:hypothetical protein